MRYVDVPVLKLNPFSNSGAVLQHVIPRPAEWAATKPVAIAGA
jgi:hypothetical protein